jgi:hypothetical protein
MKPTSAGPLTASKPVAPTNPDGFCYNLTLQFNMDACNMDACGADESGHSE